MSEGPFHIAPPDSRVCKSETFQANRPLIRIGRIGPSSRQAHRRNVWGRRLIAAAASFVGRTSGSLAFANRAFIKDIVVTSAETRAVVDDSYAAY